MYSGEQFIQELDSLLISNQQLYQEGFDVSEFILGLINNGEYKELIGRYEELVALEDKVDDFFRIITTSRFSDMLKLKEIPTQSGVSLLS